MALLGGEDTGSDTQQPMGLLGDLDPQTRQLFGMMMVQSMLGNILNNGQGGGGGGNPMSAVMSMIMNAQQMKRQKAQDAMHAQQFQLQQENAARDAARFRMLQQKDQYDLSENERKKKAQEDLANEILNGGNGNSQATTIPTQMPANSSPQPIPTQSMPQAPVGQTVTMTPDQLGQGSPMLASTNNAPIPSQNQQEFTPIWERYTGPAVDPNETKNRQMAAALVRAGDTTGARELLTQKGTESSKERAKSDIQLINKQRESAQVAGDMLPEIKDFRKILNNTSELSVGPIVGKTGINNLYSENAQQLNQIGSNLTLQARRLLQMPASGFSDADRDFLTASTLNTNYDKGTLNHIADKLETLARKAVAKNKFYELRFNKTGNLTGADSEWSEYQDKLENWANEAVQAGKDPQKVQAKLRELRGY